VEKLPIEQSKADRAVFTTGTTYECQISLFLKEIPRNEVTICHHRTVSRQQAQAIIRYGWERIAAEVPVSKIRVWDRCRAMHERPGSGVSPLPARQGQRFRA
jgi:hypothetical protein